MPVFSYKPYDDRAIVYELEPISIGGEVYLFNFKYSKWIKKGVILSHKRSDSAIISCNGCHVASIRKDHYLMEVYNERKNSMGGLPVGSN